MPALNSSTDEAAIARLTRIADENTKSLKADAATRNATIKSSAQAALRDASSGSTEAVMDKVRDLLREAKGLAKGIQDKEKSDALRMTEAVQKRARSLTDAALSKLTAAPHIKDGESDGGLSDDDAAAPKPKAKKGKRA